MSVPKKIARNVTKSKKTTKNPGPIVEGDAKPANDEKPPPTPFERLRDLLWSDTTGTGLYQLQGDLREKVREVAMLLIHGWTHTRSIVDHLPEGDGRSMVLESIDRHTSVVAQELVNIEELVDLLLVTVNDVSKVRYDYEREVEGGRRG